MQAGVRVEGNTHRGEICEKLRVRPVHPSVHNVDREWEAHALLKRPPSNVVSILKGFRHHAKSLAVPIHRHLHIAHHTVGVGQEPNHTQSLTSSNSIPTSTHTHGTKASTSSRLSALEWHREALESAQTCAATGGGGEYRHSDGPVREEEEVDDVRCTLTSP